MGLLDDGHFGLLREETKQPKIYRVIGFDSEDNTKGIPIVFTFVDGDKKYYFKDARKAIRFVLEYPVPAVFCAHNLEYDIGNLFKSCGFKWVDQMVYASRLLRVSLKFSKNYFVNSSAYFPGSVKDMGEVVGLPKLEGDPFSREYAERDAEIVWLFMTRLQKKLYEDYGAGLGVSIGQTSMEIYRRNFMPQKSQVTWCPPAALSGYYGGRVEMFYKGLITEGLDVIDFNSCYPYVMRHRTYPDTSTLKATTLDSDVFGIGKFTVLVPELYVPPLPYRYQASGRLYFPTGLMTGWWTFEEIRYAEAMGCKIIREWESVGTSDVIRPFDGFIDHFYGLREKVKTLKTQQKKLGAVDPNVLFEDVYYKLVMNNLYGKLAQHKPSQVLSRSPLPKNVLDKHPGVNVHRIDPFYSYSLARSKAPSSANYLWGIYVTAYSRLHLLDSLRTVHDTPGCKLVYCDTDSIMYTGKCDRVKLGNALGEMSHEHFDVGIFRASKGYLLCNKNVATGEYELEKVACKGVPTQYAHDFVVKGMALVRKPQRLKEALIQLQATKEAGDRTDLSNTVVKVKRLALDGSLLEKEIGINVWSNVVKEMRSIYIKRKGNLGVTQPINVQDIGAQEALSLSTTYSLEEELLESDVKITPEVRKKTIWDEELHIPANWFEEEETQKAPYQEIETRQTHYLRGSECESLGAGETWFAGTILEVRWTKKGAVYLVNLRYYMDLEVDSNSMVALLHPRYLNLEECDEEIVGYSVDVSLQQEYIKGRGLNLRVEVEEPVAATALSAKNHQAA